MEIEVVYFEILIDNLMIQKLLRFVYFRRVVV